MARKVARAELENVRLVEARAEVLVSDCLERASVREFWINFSDPWPKAAHAPRRLIQSPFIRSVAQALEPAGVVHIATDDVPYSEQIDDVLSGEPLLENLHAPRPFASEVPGRPATSYEMGWREEGRPLHFFDYRRVL
jgi:tRNA (guanine-N7-)-methyltransferase